MCPMFDDLSSLAKFQYTTPCVLRIGKKDYLIPQIVSKLLIPSNFLCVCPGCEYFELFGAGQNISAHLSSTWTLEDSLDLNPRIHCLPEACGHEKCDRYCHCFGWVSQLSTSCFSTSC